MLFFLSNFLEKIHEQLLLKAIKKFEAPSKTVRKIHHLKTAYVGIHRTESFVDIIRNILRMVSSAW